MHVNVGGYWHRVAARSRCLEQNEHEPGSGPRSLEVRGNFGSTCSVHFHVHYISHLPLFTLHDYPTGKSPKEHQGQQTAHGRRLVLRTGCMLILLVHVFFSKCSWLIAATIHAQTRPRYEAYNHKKRTTGRAKTQKQAKKIRKRSEVEIERQRARGRKRGAKEPQGGRRGGETVFGFFHPAMWQVNTSPAKASAMCESK